MSKGDLHKLVQDARKKLEGVNDDFRNEYNTLPHVFVVNPVSIKSQVLKQIGRTQKSLSDNLDIALTKAISEYVKALYDTFTFRQSKVFTYKVFGNLDYFYVIITSSEGTSNIYKQIDAIRNKYLSTLRNKIVKIFPKVTKEDTAHLLEIGHSEGHSISEVRLQKSLSQLTTFTPLAEIAGAEKVMNLVISAEERAIKNSLKRFHINFEYMEVEDESIKSNKGYRSAGENKILVEARKILDEFVANNDWANQKGSASPVELAISQLLEVSKKSGAKIVQGKIAKKTQGKSTASTTIKSKTTKKVKPVIINDDVSGLKLPKVEDTNWSSIISILNSKLQDTVAQNMHTPALNYRTGRFAHSVKVTGVEKTEQGYPSIVYTYQRNPYDVFDKSLGRPPWNTPGRDPKLLIDRSIREVMKELAVGRFYTRRA